MAASIQVKRGATAKVAAYTPLSGELVLDTTTNKLYAGDGSTAGGNQIVASRKGVTDGTDAATGELGEIISNTASGVSITTATETNLTSITLSAGDWEVEAVARADTSTAPITLIWASINTASATMAGFPYATQLSIPSSQSNQQIPTPRRRLTLTASTVIYLVAQVTFASGTVTGQGFIKARRVR
ncbi:hypothetical protein [Pantoea vagans]|uniref:hyaluronate lyase N-terminal domain-containing protein n=1 Tax=Pantoea vagans TaxID=470934 RepID=UPI003207DAD4